MSKYLYNEIVKIQHTVQSLILCNTQTDGLKGVVFSLRKENVTFRTVLLIKKRQQCACNTVGETKLTAAILMFCV